MLGTTAVGKKVLGIFRTGLEVFQGGDIGRYPQFVLLLDGFKTLPNGIYQLAGGGEYNDVFGDFIQLFFKQLVGTDQDGTILGHKVFTGCEEDLAFGCLPGKPYLFLGETLLQTFIEAEEGDLLPVVFLDDVPESLQHFVKGIAIDEFSPILLELDGKLFVNRYFKVWHVDTPGLNRLFGTLFLLSSSKKSVK
jgi:hypothetical protein